MRHQWFFWTAAFLLAGLAGCAQKAETLPGFLTTAIEKGPVVRLKAPQAVGTIALVNKEVGFVLVDVGSLYTPAEGTALKSFTPGADIAKDEATGVLSVGVERKRPFITADIVSGSPKKGDVVYE